jgi:hypothetical protein
VFMYIMCMYVYHTKISCVCMCVCVCVCVLIVSPVNEVLFVLVEVLDIVGEAVFCQEANGSQKRPNT